jgi:hypothetical protein
VALLAVVVVAVGVLAAVLTRGGSAPSTPTAATTAAAAPAPAPVATRNGAAPTQAGPPSSAAPITTTPSASESPSTAPVAGAQSPVAFVQGYYGLLPGNTDAAWALLGPTAQSQSGGRDGFNSFYGGLIRVWSENLRVTGNTVSATIVFTDKGGRVTREPYQFVVGSVDGRQVIESFSRG